MRDLITFITRALVREPDAVRVKEVDGERDRILELRVASEDKGRVIGKDGRTARAIRTIVSVASSRSGKRAKLDIVD